MTQRRRAVGRIMGVLAAGALAVAGVSACSTTVGSPGTAAQVGNARITASEVDATAASFPATVVTQSGDTPAQLKQLVVNESVFNLLATQYATANHVTVTPRAQEQITVDASAWGLTPDQAKTNKAFQMIEQYNALNQSLLGSLPNRDNTTADYQEVFDELQARHELTAGATFASVEPAIQNLAPDNLGVYNDLRAALTQKANAETIVINPRYESACAGDQGLCGGFDFPLTELIDPTSGQRVAVMYVTTGTTTSPAVIDLPATAAG